MEDVRMPDRRQSEGDGSHKARRKPMRRRQLYLVLDDWEMGTSIRKIGDPDYACGYVGLRPLPRPIYQLEAPHGYATSYATSMGSKIIIAHPMNTESQCFDPRSRYLIYGPRPHGDANHRPTFIPFGNNMLCALWGGSLQLCEGVPSRPLGQGLWSWCKVQDLPFDGSDVTSYVVHPDGQTILVSIEQKEDQWSSPTSAATYFFNMDDLSSNPTVAFDCSLPFEGCGYFVDELKSWVGLSKSYNTNGHLCSHPLVVTPDDFKRLPGKISKEDLFSNTQSESHMGATLVYMGNKEFCLAECIRVHHSYVCEGDPQNPPPFDFLLPFMDELCHPLLKLTMFSVMFDENGDLTTGNTRRFKYYSMPGPVSRSNMQYPVVFWL